MGKVKTVFYCQKCGAQSAKWLGKCPSCGTWNAYVEEVAPKTKTDTLNIRSQQTTPVNLKQISKQSKQHYHRYSTSISELDRVLGGGIVVGSLVLVGGEPGIGKSTLLLQMAVGMPQKTLYVSGEESTEQIKMRSDRIGATSENCFLYAETQLIDILQQANKLNPDILIIDSIQTLHSDRLEAVMGSISQVKECAGQLMKFAKKKNIPAFLIGHVNKEGAIAGPKALEHIVDTVLQFEGDRHLSYRILRTIKNRFGSTPELGIFEMNNQGLREVSNPSEVFISPKEAGLSGVAIGAAMEGNRPLILETQALVSPASYSSAQRSATGYDDKRLTMLLAVMEKRLGMRLSSQDVFLNIAGGIKVHDTALDFAICAAIFSSFDDTPIPDNICFFGEVGLGGEIRPIGRIESRINEAMKLGFEKIYLSKHNLNHKDITKFNIPIKPFSRLSDAFHVLFQ